MRLNVRQQFTERRKLPSMRPSQLDQISAAGCEVVARIILRRTRSGVDITGRPFRPYTPGYAAQRRREGLRTRPVDLRRTGALYASVQPKTRVVLVDGIKAGFLAAAGREFFGIRRQEERDLVTAALRRKTKAVLR